MIINTLPPEGTIIKTHRGFNTHESLFGRAKEAPVYLKHVQVNLDILLSLILDLFQLYIYIFPFI